MLAFSVEETCLDKDLLHNLQTESTFSFTNQNLRHCTQQNQNEPYCSKYWHEELNSFIVPIKDHYLGLVRDKNHSLNKYGGLGEDFNKIGPTSHFDMDILIDSRCHHSWPYNPYHRIADCLVYILSALNSYMIHHIPTRQPPFQSQHIRLALLVDESTELLCENMNKQTDFYGREIPISEDDKELLGDFQQLLRSQYLFQCIKISMFSWSPFYYKRRKNEVCRAKEFIWLEDQKDPFTFGSGHKNVSNPWVLEEAMPSKGHCVDRIQQHSGHSRYCASLDD